MLPTDTQHSGTHRDPGTQRDPENQTPKPVPRRSGRYQSLCIQPRNGQRDTGGCWWQSCAHMCMRRAEWLEMVQGSRYAQGGRVRVRVMVHSIPCRAVLHTSRGLHGSARRFPPIPKGSQRCASGPLPLGVHEVFVVPRDTIGRAPPMRVWKSPQNPMMPACPGICSVHLLNGL